MYISRKITIGGIIQLAEYLEHNKDTIDLEKIFEMKEVDTQTIIRLIFKVPEFSALVLSASLTHEIPTDGTKPKLVTVDDAKEIDLDSALNYIDEIFKINDIKSVWSRLKNALGLVGKKINLTAGAAISSI